MARELGLNPGKLGKISNHRQEPWKAPLPQFIEHLYLKRFGREQPRVVTPAEKWERSAAGRKPARDAVAGGDGDADGVPRGSAEGGEQRLAHPCSPRALEWNGAAGEAGRAPPPT